MASAAAIDALGAGFFNASPGQSPADALAGAIRGANDAVLGVAGESGRKGAASTLVAAAIDGTSAVIRHLVHNRADPLSGGASCLASAAPPARTQSSVPRFGVDALR